MRDSLRQRGRYSAYRRLYPHQRQVEPTGNERREEDTMDLMDLGEHSAVHRQPVIG
jgi:hypothetical protein